jgi:lysophospholipase L1-like esterase
VASRLSLPKRLGFSLTLLGLLLAIAEVVVRLSGAATSCTAPSLAASKIWECDPILGYRLRPVVSGVTINSRGLRGPEFDPSASFRMIALGDSCTFGMLTLGPTSSLYVEQPYPERVAALMANLSPSSVSVLNAGVPGYTSYQGDLLFRTHLRRLQPDLVSIKFGWNDLLVSGQPLPSTREAATSLGRMRDDLLLRSALYPFARRLSLAVAAEAAPGPYVAPRSWTPNIPPDDFADNLRRMVGRVRARHAEAWLLTSADPFMTDDFRGREDAYAVSAAPQLKIIKLGGIQSFRELSELRARYNGIIRDVGAETGAPVIDMEAVYREHSAEHLFTEMDAMHATDAGHALEAQAIVARLTSPGGLLARRATP